MRPRVVETAIRAGLREDWTTLRRRFKITDSRSPEHLSSECLVHLFRDAHRTGDDHRMGKILPILLGRCEAILKTKIRDLEPGASEIREEVLSKFGEVLASDAVAGRRTELDMYECRFNRAFQALRFDVVDRVRKRVGRTVEVPCGDDGDGRLLSEDEGFALLSEAGRTPATQEQSALLNDLRKQSRPYRRTNARRSCCAACTDTRWNPRIRTRSRPPCAAGAPVARFETAFRGQRRNYGDRRRSHEADPIP